MDEVLKEKLALDNENQHLKRYQEGYRECFLTKTHGEEKVWDVFQIDVDRYSPDSARRFSYNQGWNDALNDFSINK